MRRLSLYFHIPFCRKRCNYCGFYSTTDLTKREAHIAALKRELLSAPLDGFEAATVYFGGGTPTLLGEGLCALLAAVKTRLPLSPACEITLEANPCTVNAALLERWRESGFNRISFGLQDCRDAALKTLGRLHTVCEGEAAVAMAKAAGFTNISGDVMLATPGQTPEAAAALADYAASLNLPHISAYLLSIEPGTPFAESGIAAQCPDADGAADCYLAACAALEACGYAHYEISNFAFPGYESRHNTAYWRLDDYLGFGPAAHSFFGGRRFHHAPDLDGYLVAADPWETRIDDGAGGTPQERLMLALRLAEGFAFADCPRCGIDPGELRAKAAPLAKAGLLALTQERIALTDRGFLLSNSIITELSETIKERTVWQEA